MIRLLLPLEKTPIIACSGGVDSMALLEFARRGKRSVSAAFFDHGTEYCEKAKATVIDYCSKHSIPVHVGNLSRDRRHNESIEEFWRNERYNFLERLDGIVYTAHTLDDCVETYIFSSLNGSPKVIPHKRNNIIRPMLITKKDDLRKWCIDKKVAWFECPSNDSLLHRRNLIRHSLVPIAKQVNPGIDTMVKKIVMKRYKEYEKQIY